MPSEKDLSGSNAAAVHAQNIPIYGCMDVYSMDGKE